jgi:3-phenylpropionate/cinnamic acid dioxygenase small subunit
MADDPFIPQACDYFALINLAHAYADALDNGEFDRIGMLFHHADIYMPGSQEPEVRAGSGGFGELLRKAVRTYPPGNTPRTRHVTTNHQIHFEGPDAARMRSYFTVLQETAPGQLEAIITGTYEDRFVRADGHWRFAERRETVTGAGDLSAHLVNGFDGPRDN